jgi:hypothetical protein
VGEVREERGNQKGDTNMAVICMQASTGYFARLCVCMYGADPSLTRPVFLVGNGRAVSQSRIPIRARVGTMAVTREPEHLNFGTWS